MTTTTNLGLTEPTVGGDSDTWGGELNTDLGLIDAFAKALMCGAPVDVASASTCDIGAAANAAVNITGGVSISSFGTVANQIRFVTFAGSPRLNHNGASLYLLGGVDHKTSAGDVGIYRSDSLGNWKELAFFPVNTDPTGKGYQSKLNDKTGISSGTTFFQIPVTVDNIRQSVKIYISAESDNPSSAGYCSEYSEHVLDYGSYAGSYHTPVGTRLAQAQNSFSSSTAQISMAVSGSIAGGTLSIIITPTFSGLSPATSARINARAEALGPGMTNLITAA